MQVLDCSTCGAGLTLPAGLAEGAAFACPDCGAVLRNGPAARDFRWESLDPSLRRHGASRGSLWGGAVGALAWPVVLAALMLVRGRFAVGALVAIGVPYLALLVVLRLLRPRRTAAAWMMAVWMGLGAYCLYLGSLALLAADRAQALAGVVEVAPSLLFALGGAWLAIGALGTWLLRARSARLPQAALAGSAAGSAARGALRDDPSTHDPGTGEQR